MIRDPLELLVRLGLDQDPALVSAAQRAALLFPVRVTESFVARMVPGDRHDPLLRQVLPLAEECDLVAGFGDDPVGESAFMPTRGVLQKYQGRALVLATGACAIHCRYCFRRAYPYSEAIMTDDAIDAVVTQIKSQGLTEIILSGGDPLMLSNDKLFSLIDRCITETTVDTIRIHSRLPIVLPERLDDAFCSRWNALPLHRILVIHANHAAELDAQVGAHLRKLSGTQLLNQAVLLKGVNDTVDDLVALSRASFEVRALPYYLHVLDKVSGAAHFDVDELRAKSLLAGMQAQLPGYLVPHLVREEVGGLSKTRLG